MSTQTEAVNRPDIPPGEFLGHPKALWQLSNIEMWERFSYYGMRALLAVYVATTFFGHLGDQANAEASLVYGGYTALVYATGIIGGYIVYLFSGRSFNPVIGIAGVSCVPTTAKVAQKEAHAANKFAMILPWAMGASVSGVITSAIIAGIYVSVLQNVP